ncbi:ribosomal protein S18-alanine N-acetyltransferase [Lacticaseibacillus hulanensis]|uniref:ribosomal protein S18-alanine N-acetyltransferase n=1 Tax=Lacticaseibacillus hulanensis TaxID=2493111 RepID=UPI0013E3DFBD|nr:ribosomal protein S18-alanine N-acetyltransferase [Lacticaseibacillus hulanensis]
MFRRFKDWLARRQAIRDGFLPHPITINGATYSLRRMTEADIPAALDLERAVYGDTPWEKMAFMSELQKKSTALYLVLVVPESGQLAAFIGASFRRLESHITNIAVHPQFQRQGIGRTLMELMLDRSKTMGIQVVSLEVRLDNVHAQSLYRSLGFVDGRVRRNYYTRERADAIDMAVKLSGSTDKAPINDCDHNATV